MHSQALIPSRAPFRGQHSGQARSRCASRRTGCAGLSGGPPRSCRLPTAWQGQGQVRGSGQGQGQGPGSGSGPGSASVSVSVSVSKAGSGSGPGSECGQGGPTDLLWRHVQALHHAVLIEPRHDRGAWPRRQLRLQLLIGDSTIVCTQRLDRPSNGVGLETHGQQGAPELGQLELAVVVHVPLVKHRTEVISDWRWWWRRLHRRARLAVEDLVPPRGLLGKHGVAGSGSAHGRRARHARGRQTERRARREDGEHVFGLAVACVRAPRAARKFLRRLQRKTRAVFFARFVFRPHDCETYVPPSPRPRSLGPLTPTAQVAGRRSDTGTPSTERPIVPISASISV